MDRGEIYLGPFMYADLAGSKRRPVCVVSSPKYNAGPDVMVAMISSGARVASPRIGDDLAAVDQALKGILGLSSDEPRPT